MKKILSVLMIVILLLFLVGCDENNENIKSATNDKNITLGEHNDEILFWTDTETGVEYVVYKGYRKGGITPRLNADGTLYKGGAE